jgi:hypothetical protein
MVFRVHSVIKIGSKTVSYLGKCGLCFVKFRIPKSSRELKTGEVFNLHNFLLRSPSSPCFVFKSLVGVKAQTIRRNKTGVPCYSKDGLFSLSRCYFWVNYVLGVNFKGLLGRYSWVPGFRDRLTRVLLWRLAVRGYWTNPRRGILPQSLAPVVRNFMIDIDRWVSRKVPSTAPFLCVVSGIAGRVFSFPYCMDALVCV